MNKVCLVVGRFQPLTKSCAALLRETQAKGYDVTICIIGEHLPRSHRYPFKANEQIRMLESIGLSAVAVDEVLMRKDRHRQFFDLNPQADILLLDPAYGRFLAEDWQGGEVLTAPAGLLEEMEQAKNVWLSGKVSDHVSEPVASLIAALLGDEEREALWAEEQYVQAYRESWKVAPYSPVLVTADVLIQREGKVLLIQRGGTPGRGLWAMPGGFVDADETLFEAACRELREETGLALPYDVARSCLVRKKVFDDPARSSRGRTTTHGYYFDITGHETDPLAAGDDAAALKWVGVECALKMRAHMFEDHFLMVEYLLTAAGGVDLD